jgi:hypothetical protein
MKKIRGDKPIGVTIHIYMEISQGNSLCSYLYLKQAKISWFSFLSFLFFSSTKSENRGSSCPGQREGRSVPMEKGRWQGKGVVICR